MTARSLRFSFAALVSSLSLVLAFATRADATAPVYTAVNNDGGDGSGLVLPLGRDQAGMAWDGNAGYIMGGEPWTAEGERRRIVKYTPPSSGSSHGGSIAYEPSNTDFSQELSRAPATWGAGKGYFFGGRWGENETQKSSTVYSYSPGSAPSAVNAALEYPTEGIAAAYGITVNASCLPLGCSFLFGGRSSATTPTLLNKIYMYNPVSDLISTSSATLPSNRGYMAVAWDPTPRLKSDQPCFMGCAYLFGGRGIIAGSESILNSIVRYDAKTNSAVVMESVLPQGRAEASAIWDPNKVYDPILETYVCLEGCAYIFGGYSLSQGSYTLYPDILRYDPALDGDARSVVAVASLPDPERRDAEGDLGQSGRAGTAAACRKPSSAVVIGGRSANESAQPVNRVDSGEEWEYPRDIIEFSFDNSIGNDLPLDIPVIGEVIYDATQAARAGVAVGDAALAFLGLHCSKLIGSIVEFIVEQELDPVTNTWQSVATEPFTVGLPVHMARIAPASVGVLDPNSSFCQKRTLRVKATTTDGSTIISNKLRVAWGPAGTCIQPGQLVDF